MKSTAMSTALAIGVLMATGAFAADKAPTTTSQASMPVTTETSARHPTKEQCKADSRAKNLVGKELNKFLKDCEAGKAAI